MMILEGYWETRIAVFPHDFFQLTKESFLTENNNRMLSKLKQNRESKVSKISVSFDFYNVTFKKATTKLIVATQFFLEPK